MVEINVYVRVYDSLRETYVIQVRDGFLRTEISSGTTIETRPSLQTEIIKHPCADRFPIPPDKLLGGSDIFGAYYVRPLLKGEHLRVFRRMLPDEAAVDI